MAALSGQTTVASAGTAVVLAAAGTRADGVLWIGALSTNTGKVYVGNDGAGDVTNENGAELAAGDKVALEFVGDLSGILVDAATNGDKVWWLVGKKV